MGRNPRTGKEVSIPPRKVMGFKPSRFSGSASPVSRRRLNWILFAAVHSSAVGPRLPTRNAPVHGSYPTNTGKVILALSISADGPRFPSQRAPVHGSYRTNTGKVVLA